MAKVVPKSTFVEAAILLAVDHMVLLHTDGGEDLREEAVGVAWCQEHQQNGCKMMALSTSVLRTCLCANSWAP